VNVVIPSEARNLALETKGLRDSSSPAAPRNDKLDGFFGILLEIWTLLLLSSLHRPRKSRGALLMGEAFCHAANSASSSPARTLSTLA
jgi:hypothetical protein